MKNFTLSLCVLLLIFLNSCSPHHVATAPLVLAETAIALPLLPLVAVIEVGGGLLDYERNISNEPEVKEYIGRIFELHEDVFLYTSMKGSYDYRLGTSKEGSALPTSIEEYLNDPDNWQYSDTNAQEGRGPPLYGKRHVIGVIKKGTPVMLKKVTRKNSCHLVKMTAELLDSEWKGEIVECSSIFEDQLDLPMSQA